MTADLHAGFMTEARVPDGGAERDRRHRPKGGGEIDLSQVTRDQQGTFRVIFDLGDFEKTDDMKVYFVSEARKRRLQGEIWGVGCSKYLDVTSFVKKKMTKEKL